VYTVAVVTPALEARTKKGDQYLKLGAKAESEKKYDLALDYFNKALTTDPKDPGYMLANQRVRGEAVQFHLAAGRELQQKQQIEQALVEFQKAFIADPSSQVSLQEIAQTTAMLKRKAQLPAGTPILTPAQQMQQQVEQRIQSLEGPPTLRPITNQINSLKMNNQPARVLYDSVGKLAGINVLFDPTGIDPTGSKNFNLDLNNVTLEEALNYVGLVTHTFWKPISRNAIFVTQDTETKRQEYQDEVVKVFYVQNASTPTEFTDIYNGVRTGAKLMTGLFQIPSQNAIIARGNPDMIALVEKLVHDLDKPKPEVIVDVIMMEVSRDKTSTLGAAIAGATGGLNQQILYTPRNYVTVTTNNNNNNNGGTTGTTGTGTNTGTGTTSTTTTTTGNTGAATLASLGHISSADFSTSLPGAVVQALLTDNSTRVLQRPQVRVTDGGKASIKIGSKIPYVSGSLNSAVATPGAIPYATTQFQEVDVGTNIDLQAHVNGPDDVTMHIKVEVSQVLYTETIAGVQQPVIGQKVDEADVRMKDGEVSLLGGLSSQDDELDVAGIPGVSNIPLLGYLFGIKTRTHNRDEVLMAMIPHIVRAPDLSVMGEDGVVAGTERQTRVLRGPNGTPVAGSSSDVPPANAVPVTAPSPLAPAPNRPRGIVPGANPNPGAPPQSTSQTPSSAITPQIVNPNPAATPAHPANPGSPPQAANQPATSTDQPAAPHS